MSTATTQTPSHEVDPSTARQWIESGEAVLVDVREPDESAAERIEGAKLVPLSRFDPAQVPAPPAGGKVILHCRSGRRSSEARARLVQAGRSDVYSLEGGIEAWRSAGLPTHINRRAPIAIMRQVQITAGSLVLLGTLLGVFLSEWFLIIPGFVGAGLIFAGASGFCGMAAVLTYMPWNRALRTAC